MWVIWAADLIWPEAINVHWWFLFAFPGDRTSCKFAAGDEAQNCPRPSAPRHPMAKSLCRIIIFSPSIAQSSPLNMWMEPDARANLRSQCEWVRAWLPFGAYVHTLRYHTLHCSPHLKLVVNIHFVRHDQRRRRWWYSGGSGDCFPFILFCDKKERYGGSRSLLLWPSGVPWQLVVHIVIKGGYMAIRSPPVGTVSRAIWWQGMSERVTELRWMNECLLHGYKIKYTTR